MGRNLGGLWDAIANTGILTKTQNNSLIVLIGGEQPVAATMQITANHVVLRNDVSRRNCERPFLLSRLQDGDVVRRGNVEIN